MWSYIQMKMPACRTSRESMGGDNSPNRDNSPLSEILSDNRMNNWFQFIIFQPRGGNIVKCLCVYVSIYTYISYITHITYDSRSSKGPVTLIKITSKVQNLNGIFASVRSLKTVWHHKRFSKDWKWSHKTPGSLTVWVGWRFLEDSMKILDHTIFDRILISVSRP